MEPTKKNEYGLLDTYVVRTPIKSLDFSLRLFEHITDKAYLKSLLGDAFIHEAIALASPNLAEALKAPGFRMDPLAYKHEKLLSAFLRYVIRMGSRCTPFGLFAGVAIGHFGPKTQMERQEASPYRRNTVLDADVHRSLIDKFLSRPKIREHWKWHVNSTLYRGRNEVRYFENTSDGKTLLQLSPMTPALKKVCKEAWDGVSYGDLEASLMQLGHPKKSSSKFLDVLIDNKMLVPEGRDTILREKTVASIWEHLKSMADTDLDRHLMEIIIHLKNLDNGITDPQRNLKLFDVLPNSATKSKNSTRAPVMVNTFPRYTFNTLDKKLKGLLQNSLDTLLRCSPPHGIPDYQEFMQIFRKRYGQKHMRLVDVLDIDYGLGYPVGHYGNTEDYIRSFGIELQKDKEPPARPLNPFERLLERELETSGICGKTLVLSEKELRNLPQVEHGFGKTFFGLFELLQIDGNTYIHPISMGGSSAAQLHARFALGNLELGSWYSKILAKEKGVKSRTIPMEVAYRPQAAANIAKRPGLREYTLYYGSTPCSEHTQRIPVEDLFLKLEGEALCLYSGNLDKPVQPYLTTAHNHKLSTLPIIRFLGDHQFQGKRPYAYFSWGHLEEGRSYLPRVVHKNILLAKAIWLLTPKAVGHLKKQRGNPEMSLSKVWPEVHLPRYVQWVEDDQKLMLDTESHGSLKMLLTAMGNRDALKLEEFLPPAEGLVKNAHGERFACEFQCSFYRSRG